LVKIMDGGGEVVKSVISVPVFLLMMFLSPSMTPSHRLLAWIFVVLVTMISLF